MKVTIEDVFPGIDAAGYESLYFDETFCEAVGHELKLGRQLVRLERNPARIVRHVCFEPARDPNSPAGQAFGTSRASFVEELDYDLHTHRGAWKTIPNIFTDRVTNAGTIEIGAAPGGGTRRIVRGEVTVRLLGFGRVVERMIVGEIEKSYARTAAFTTAWIARRAR